MIVLNAKDQSIVDKYLTEHHSHVLSKINTLRHRLKRWEKFVKDIEEGYMLTIYDYSNELTYRETLENIINIISDEGKKKIKIEIESIDKRLKEATSKSKKPLYKSDKDYWWYFRVPKKLIGELKKDITSFYGLNSNEKKYKKNY